MLKEATLRLLEKGQTYGSYEVHSTVPSFFLLQGNKPMTKERQASNA